MIDPNQAFKLGNKNKPVNVSEIPNTPQFTTVRDTSSGADAESFEVIAEMVQYYNIDSDGDGVLDNDIGAQFPIPVYSSVFTPQSYPYTVTYYLDLYLNDIGCTSCYLIHYGAGCTADIDFAGGNTYTESNAPPDGNLITGLYDSITDVEEQIPGTVDISGVPTTVLVDEYYCGAGNYIYFLKKYEDLKLNAGQCNNYALTNEGKEVDYLDVQDLTLSLTESSGLGSLGAAPTLAQLYEQYNQGYASTHIVCTERFVVNK